MGLLGRIVAAVLPPKVRTPDVVLQESTRLSLTHPGTHRYTACTYSTYWRAWVKTCRDCGRVVTC